MDDDVQAARRRIRAERQQRALQTWEEANPEQPKVKVTKLDPPPATPLPAQPTKPPAGWYPDPKMAQTQRYWDGEKWGDNVAPMPNTSAASSSSGSSPLLIGLVLAGSAIGVVMAMQSASLLTGTGTLWTGVAIAGGAGILGWVVKVPIGVRILAGIAVVLAFANASSVESQLDKNRQEINHLVQR